MDNGNNNGDGLNLRSLTRLLLFVKRRLKLNRFLLVIDTKKGVVISAVTIIVSDILGKSEDSYAQLVQRT